MGIRMIGWKKTILLVLAGVAVVVAGLMTYAVMAFKLGVISIPSVAFNMDGNSSAINNLVVVWKTDSSQDETEYAWNLGAGYQVRRRDKATGQVNETGTNTLSLAPGLTNLKNREERMNKVGESLVALGKEFIQAKNQESGNDIGGEVWLEIAAISDNSMVAWLKYNYSHADSGDLLYRFNWDKDKWVRSGEPPVEGWRMIELADLNGDDMPDWEIQTSYFGMGYSESGSTLYLGGEMKKTNLHLDSTENEAGGCENDFYSARWEVDTKAQPYPLVKLIKVAHTHQAQKEGEEPFEPPCKNEKVSEPEVQLFQWNPAKAAFAPVTAP